MKKVPPFARESKVFCVNVVYFLLIVRQISANARLTFAMIQNKIILKLMETQKGAAIMFSMKHFSFNGFMPANSAASSFCAILSVRLDAALLASILFVLLAVFLASWGILDVLVPQAVLILIGIVQLPIKKPESLA